MKYLEDTAKFWRMREKARAKLEKWWANLPYTEKVAIAEKLRADVEFLKRGRPVSKPSTKSSTKPQ